MRLKPDHLYAMLGNVIRLNPKLHILDGNERMLTMKLIKLDESEKPEFHFGLTISYDGIFSSMHCTIPDREHQDRLKDAVTEVLQMLVAYDASDSVRKLNLPLPDRDGAPSSL
jgi:hypothetical protein